MATLTGLSTKLSSSIGLTKSGTTESNLLLQTTMKNTTYKIQFFGGPKAEWKELPTLQEIATLEEAKAFKKAQQEMCNYMIDFRIVEVY